MSPVSKFPAKSKKKKLLMKRNKNEFELKLAM